MKVGAKEKLIATRSIKISERAHYQLRMMAATHGERIWELVDQAVVLLGRRKATNGQRREKGTAK